MRDMYFNLMGMDFILENKLTISSFAFAGEYTHTHTHTYIYIYRRAFLFDNLQLLQPPNGF
jgi:hypothetical protein